MYISGIVLICNFQYFAGSNQNYYRGGGGGGWGGGGGSNHSDILAVILFGCHCF